MLVPNLLSVSSFGNTLVLTHSIDTKYLTYVDFLEALLRTAAMYPVAEKEKYPTLESKLNLVISKLKEKFKEGINDFLQLLEKKDEEMKYQVKMVVNELDEEDESGAEDDRGEETLA